MEEARDNAGNDMLKMMQVVFPVATQIEMNVIQKYGFSGDGDGKEMWICYELKAFILIWVASYSFIYLFIDQLAYFLSFLFV